MDNKLLPEGFKELFQYIQNISTTKNTVTTKEIQDSLAKHKFTSGKITGIIHRAENLKYLNKIKRGVYSFNLDLITEESDSDKVMSLVSKEIRNTIDNIKKILVENITSTSQKEIEKIKENIHLLEKLSE